MAVKKIVQIGHEALKKFQNLLKMLMKLKD